MLDFSHSFTRYSDQTFTVPLTTNNIQPACTSGRGELCCGVRLIERHTV